MEEYDGIDIRSRDGIKVPTDEKNLIYWSAKRLYEECGKKLPGLKIEQQSDIPMARGLGSSSACIVAGLMGANRFLGNPLTLSDMVNLACQIERACAGCGRRRGTGRRTVWQGSPLVP